MGNHGRDGFHSRDENIHSGQVKQQWLYPLGRSVVGATF